MRTKLRVLALLGILLLFLPIIYIPATFWRVVIGISGLVILWLTWRIALQYRRTLNLIHDHSEPRV